MGTNGNPATKVQVVIDYNLATGQFDVSGPINDRRVMKMILTEAYDFVCEMHPLNPKKHQLVVVPPPQN